MCVIAVSPKGVRQPTVNQFRTMWYHNPHGAGYMYSRDGEVYIRKGFMTLDDFMQAVKDEHFTPKDPVVYHFRISTQAGVNPGMTHPFPMTEKVSELTGQNVICQIGFAHNGIIPMTSDRRQNTYSDTALFVAQYMPVLIRDPSDIHNPFVHDLLLELTRSKWAIMDGTGSIETVGKFTADHGLLFSNESYKPYTFLQGGM